MKSLCLPIIFFIVLAGLAAAAAAENSITVKVAGIETQKGRVSIGLFDNAGDFPHLDRVFRGTFVAINGDSIQYVFKDVPIGKYAIAVYQDLNNNKKLDTNFLHIPKEPYGFSRNAKPSFGPPDFKDAAFDLKGFRVEKIRLRH